MPIRQKRFPCGHKGRGQYCHACAQRDAARLAEEQQRADRRKTKATRAAAFHHDAIDLRLLPLPALIEKARQILRHVATSQDYRPFFGKRMETDRSLLSVPANYRYRLLFRIHQRPHRATVGHVP